MAFLLHKLFVGTLSWYFTHTLYFLCIFIIQKSKCPKCSRILGGKATTKKNENTYFYYYCNDCKIEFKEKIIMIILISSLNLS